MGTKVKSGSDALGWCVRCGNIIIRISHLPINVHRNRYVWSRAPYCMRVPWGGFVAPTRTYEPRDCDGSQRNVDMIDMSQQEYLQRISMNILKIRKESYEKLTPDVLSGRLPKKFSSFCPLGNEKKKVMVTTPAPKIQTARNTARTLCRKSHRLRRKM